MAEMPSLQSHTVQAKDFIVNGTKNSSITDGVEEFWQPVYPDGRAAEKTYGMPPRKQSEEKTLLLPVR